MAWQHTIDAYPTVIATVVSLGLAGYAVHARHRNERTTTVAAFAALCVVTAVWTGFSAVELASTDPAVKLAAYRIRHAGRAATAPLLVAFALAYTDRRDWLRPWVLAGLFAVPAVSVAILFSNPYDLAVADRHLVDVGGLVVQRIEAGPAHVLLGSAYPLVLGGVTLGLVGQEVYHQGRAYRPQAALLAVAVLAPPTAALLARAGVAPFDARTLDVVPVAAGVSVGALGLAIARYRLVDLTSIAARTAIQHSTAGVLVLDRDRRIVHANPAGTALLDRPSNVRGEPIEDVLPGVDPADATGEVVPRQSSTGEDRFLEVDSRRLAHRGEYVGWVMTLGDVTEARRRERELETLTEVVPRALRQHVDATGEHLERLEAHTGADLDEEGSALLDAARQHDDHLQRMVTDLQQYAEIDRGEDDFEPVDCEALVSTVVADHRSAIDDRHATVVVEDLPTVRGDESLLGRLFEHLLSNALDHAGDAPEIRIGAMRGGGRWHFAVSDDGPGIDPAEREAVLDPFARGTDDGPDSDSGTGMGLALCERIAAVHGGSIDLDSTPGGGTTVTVTLPAGSDG